VRLDNEPAIDGSGYAGLQAKVDLHTSMLLKDARQQPTNMRCSPIKFRTAASLRTCRSGEEMLRDSNAPIVIVPEIHSANEWLTIG
jgi:hypothetical protein